MKINDAVIYLTDNGAAYCGAHLGMTARMTGRDISGQTIFPLTPDVIAEEPDAMHMKCERCGKAPSRIYVEA